MHVFRKPFLFSVLSTCHQARALQPCKECHRHLPTGSCLLRWHVVLLGGSGCKHSDVSVEESHTVVSTRPASHVCNPERCVNHTRPLKITVELVYGIILMAQRASTVLGCECLKIPRILVTRPPTYTCWVLPQQDRKNLMRRILRNISNAKIPRIAPISVFRESVNWTTHALNVLTEHSK